MRISDWSSDVCSSDLRTAGSRIRTARGIGPARASIPRMGPAGRRRRLAAPGPGLPATDRTLARTTAALHRQDAGKLAAFGRAARDAARRHGDRTAPPPARNPVVVLQATLLPAAAFFARLRPHPPPPGHPP